MKNNNALKSFIKNNIALASIKVIILITGVIFCLLKINLSWLLSNTDGASKLSTLLEMCILMVGVYTAVISIFATSSVPISYKLCLKNRSSEFIAFLFIGIIESFVLIAVLVFFDITWYITPYVIVTFVVESFFSFVVFILMIINTCKYNILESAKRYEQDEIDMNNILSNLEQIKIDVSKINNKPR